MTMTLISTVTVGAGGAATIDFGSIPQTGTDLLVVLSTRTNRAAAIDNVRFKINNDSTSGRYSGKLLYGDPNGGGAGSLNSGVSTAGDAGDSVGNTATSNTFGNCQVYLPNYAGSNQKSWSSDSVTENNATQAEELIIAGLYNQTTAISSLSFFPVTGTVFQQYSTASLYTITKGSGGATVS